MVGQTLNHYRIVSQIGRGGMGEVYVAEDTKLDRKVALKVLPPEMAMDAERRARFEREAKAVASLNHPNIVTVFSVEQSGETHFITMELVEGPTLSEILAGQRPSTSKLLDYAVELADAVTGAHRKGITHRDLKPDNVMLAENGRIKVLDFGLAKLAEGAGQSSQHTLPTQTVTQEGKILGTVAYMSPEQAEGKTADARSDVFSLGVMLYEMTTGERPFAGDTSISTITSILRDVPRSVTDLNRTLPRHLGRIVKRCLEKDPERRYQTAQDLRNDLQDLRDEMQSGELSATEGTVAPVAASRRKNWLAIGLGVVAVAAIALALMQFAGRRSERLSAPQAPTGAAMEIRPLTVSGNSGEATISSDGRYVAYVLTDGAGRRPTSVGDGGIPRHACSCLLPRLRPGHQLLQGGLSDPEDPAIAVRDLTGALLVWIDVGNPDAARLHKASKAAARVAVYTHKDPERLLRQWSGERVHRAAQLELYGLDRPLVAGLAARLKRRMAFTLAVTGGHLYLALDGEALDGPVERHALPAA